MTTHPLKYLIAGTGGVGGSIAAFLALAGKDVTCIARGEHLAAIRENGLQLHSDLKGEYALRVPAYTAEEYTALVSTSADYKADVIFVCVKGYSVDSITELIKSAAHEHTVVIPILKVICILGRLRFVAVYLNFSATILYVGTSIPCSSAAVIMSKSKPCTSL